MTGTITKQNAFLLKRGSSPFLHLFTFLIEETKNTTVIITTEILRIIVIETKGSILLMALRNIIARTIGVVAIEPASITGVNINGKNKHIVYMIDANIKITLLRLICLGTSTNSLKLSFPIFFISDPQ